MSQDDSGREARASANAAYWGRVREERVAAFDAVGVDKAWRYKMRWSAQAHPGAERRLLMATNASTKVLYPDGSTKSYCDAMGRTPEQLADETLAWRDAQVLREVEELRERRRRVATHTAPMRKVERIVAPRVERRREARVSRPREHRSSRTRPTRAGPSEDPSPSDPADDDPRLVGGVAELAGLAALAGELLGHTIAVETLLGMGAVDEATAASRLAEDAATDLRDGIGQLVGELRRTAAA